MRATTSHRWGFPCSDDFLFHACRRHYPGGTVGCCRYPVQRRRPSLKRRQVGFRIILFEACSAFTHVSACMVAKSPKSDPLHQSTSTHLLPPASPWLLPAERPIGRVGFAPTENRRLSRHTPLMRRLTRDGLLGQSARVGVRHRMQLANCDVLPGCCRARHLTASAWRAQDTPSGAR